MPRFFVPSAQITETELTLLGTDAHHIARALRMAVGEHITVSDMHRGSLECELTRITDTEVTARILSRTVDTVEPPFGATLYQAIPKGDKMGEIVEKAVECGVTRIVPVLTERCVSRPDGKALEGKRARWQKIAESAAKQSGRGVIPEIAPMFSFAQAVEEIKGAALPLFCYEGEGTRPLAQVLRENQPSGKEVRFLIGSEGGFSTAEAEQAIAAGLIPVGLGKRILRTETAAAFVLACLVYETELG